MTKYIKTKTFRHYIIKFIIRISIFLATFLFYLKDKKLMYELANQSIYKGITPMHILWLIFMIMMIGHIFPTERLSMAFRKSEKKEYHEIKDYDELELLKFVQFQNVRAWMVMFV